MDKLVIKSKTKQRLSQFCTSELLESVFSRVNNITVDVTNLCKNIWDVTNLVHAKHDDLLDNLKVILVFYELGGTLIYEGNEVWYPLLFRLINKNEPNAVLLYWAHNEANEVKPFYGIGEIEIPRIMPRFICTEISENAFQVERWQQGEYVAMDEEIFPSRELCEERIQVFMQYYDNLDLDVNKQHFGETARLNMYETDDCLFPYNGWDVRIFGNDYTPARFHIMREGWNVSFSIYNGELLEINSRGKRQEILDYMCANVKKWLSDSCIIQPKLTNQENACLSWEQIH